MEISEELQLVERSKSDIHAFAKLYNYYFPKLYAFTYNRVTDKQLAEDIVCEVFLDAVKAIKKFDTKKNKRFGAWVYRVAHNKIVDYYKKNKGQISVEYNDIQMLPQEPDLDRDIQIAEIKAKINYIISKLKPRYQMIISLKFMQELDREEISQVMQIKPSQVNLISHRALQSFKKNWNKNFPKSEINNYF